MADDQAFNPVDGTPVPTETISFTASEDGRPVTYSITSSENDSEVTGTLDDEQSSQLLQLLLSIVFLDLTAALDATALMTAPDATG